MAVYVENEDGVLELVRKDLTQNVIEDMMADAALLAGTEMSPCGEVTMKEFKKGLGANNGS
jgi:hypothetical protein